MGNDLRERLEALSAGACASEWGQYSPSYGPWKEQARQDRCTKWDTSHHVSRMGVDNNPVRVAQFKHADTAAFVETLVNAFRSGDLVTRSEMEEVVAKEREACADLCEERAEVLDDMGIETECCVATAKNCADDIRARAEQQDDKSGLDVTIPVMKLTGNREEYYVMISCGGRDVAVGNYPQGYMNRALYQHDMLRHVIFNEPRPRLADEKYSDPADLPEKKGSE